MGAPEPAVAAEARPVAEGVTPEELEQAKAKACAALDVALGAAATEEDSPRPFWPEEPEAARKEPTDAPEVSVLKTPAHESTTGALGELEGIPQDAFPATLTGSAEDDATGTLEPAAGVTPEELEQAKARACVALEVALGPSAGVDDSALPLLPEELEAARKKARHALEVSMLQTPEQEATPGVPEELTEAPQEAAAEDIEAQPAEAAAQPQGELPQREMEESVKQELAAASAVQGRLGVAKERMADVNVALKAEVGQLHEDLNHLIHQRNTLKQNLERGVP